MTNWEPSANQVQAVKLADWIEANRSEPAHKYIDGLIAFINAATAQARREALEWQPIETVPKDGTFVLLGWFEMEGQNSQEVAFWNSRIQRWCQIHDSFTDHAAFQPTHWLPLPEAPNRALVPDE